jgi:hypothetical protein
MKIMIKLLIPIGLMAMAGCVVAPYGYYRGYGAPYGYHRGYYGPHVVVRSAPVVVIRPYP